MTQGMYHQIKKAWIKPDVETLRKRMIEWRRGEVFTRVVKPLRLDKVRSLGYKAKKGFVVIRVRVKRGGHTRPRPVKARKGSRMHTHKNLKMNYRWIAEQRVERKFKNLTLLNSYPIGKDGMNYFFEVILVDSKRPEISNDQTLKWTSDSKNKKRAMRGLTSAAKKSRGLR